jgi:hypothetical protein
MYFCFHATCCLYLCLFNTHVPFFVLVLAQTELLSSLPLSKKKKKSFLQRDDDDNITRIPPQLLDRVASTSGQIVECTQSMMELEEAVLVPMVARLVPAAEQKSFNTKVIMNLGVLDSRLHLVGMHQAVVNSKKELRLFRLSIPSFPQGMIPRWKRLLYDPRVAIVQRILRDDE